MRRRRDGGRLLLTSVFERVHPLVRSPALLLVEGIDLGFVGRRAALGVLVDEFPPAAANAAAAAIQQEDRYANDGAHHP
jgi:hypothetical protein